MAENLRSGQSGLGEKLVEINHRLNAGLAVESTSIFPGAVLHDPRIPTSQVLFKRLLQSDGVRDTSPPLVIQNGKDFTCIAGFEVLQAAEVSGGHEVGVGVLKNVPDGYSLHDLRLVFHDPSHQSRIPFTTLEAVNAWEQGTASDIPALYQASMWRRKTQAGTLKVTDLVQVDAAFGIQVSHF